MTGRDRRREEDEELERDLFRKPLDDDVLDKSAAELDLEEEQGLHATDDDAGLLDMDASEFEHLRRKRDRT